jgi:hypothetical protein
MRITKLTRKVFANTFKHATEIRRKSPRTFEKMFREWKERHL